MIDAAPEFAEAGAGIRVPPNSSRLLLRWGIDLENMRKSVSKRYHFVHLHEALPTAARNAGVEVLTQKRVVSYDLVVCADGIKSIARLPPDALLPRPGHSADVAALRQYLALGTGTKRQYELPRKP
ncbi:hypothetical protein F4820DRAFT_449867 [Hypoxylon rubiginosum]|uniref:Uncharacterized protein n=1 Tax=Hypoxylon rubiginosum TaxID=110542 RepID=A0ACB9YW30_9PEZI|nr:hypothetical protein F4820DRAFT_449867 [Hypoxylon rubiginosum]